MDKVEKLDKKIRFQKNVEQTFDAITAIILAIIIIYGGFVLYDMLKLARDGYDTVPDMSYARLSKINPDLVAWLKMEGTHINHPVVQGKDNFEYLDINFYRQAYVGGTLFLDVRNKRDFSDQYNIIHGHHMDMGAMFGDLGKYLEKEFFDKHTTGLLKTPFGNYDLKVVGVGVINAYDNVLEPNTANAAILSQKCKHVRNFKQCKILALSTCTANLNDDRTVVFCRMKPNGDIWK